MIQAILTITNSTGLHARPAAQLVQTAAGFQSEVKIHGKDKSANAKSILAVMSMGLSCGSQITIIADGSDEQQCIAALTELIKNNFGEE